MIFIKTIHVIYVICRHESVFATLRTIEGANKDTESICNITTYRFNKVCQWFDGLSEIEQHYLYLEASNKKKNNKIREE